MKASESYNEFRRVLKQHGRKVAGLMPCDGIPLFQSFYQNTRCSDVEEKDGDGLVCYYGMSRDGGFKFEVGTIRVFRIANTPPAEAGSRLRLSFTYPFVETIIRAGLENVGLPEGNSFCWSPNNQAELQRFIDASPQIQHVLSKAPSVTKLRLENIWGAF